MLDLSKEQSANRVRKIFKNGKIFCSAQQKKARPGCCKSPKRKVCIIIGKKGAYISVENYIRPKKRWGALCSLRIVFWVAVPL